MTVTSSAAVDVSLVDPRTGRVRGTLTAAPAADIAQQVQTARAAQRDWGARTPADRAARLFALAALIESDVERFVAAEIAGTGKPVAEATGEVRTAADVIRFYAGAARAGIAPASGRLLPERESWVRWEPMGVVACIVPWNYPLLMAAWRIAPALAAGNAVLLKPAETTPDSAVLLQESAEAILGPGVLTVVPGDRATGRALVASEVDMIAFTGSAAAGLEVATSAGLRRTSLELGGNCPVLVLPGAPDYSYDAIVDACVYNAGQSCAAPARVIALSEHYDAVVQGLATAMSKRRAGVDFGPLNNADQAARYDRIVDESKGEAVVVAPTQIAAHETDGFWRPGRIIATHAQDDTAVAQEVFGPCLTVQPADDLDHAVRLANSTPHALAASVWGRDAGRLLRVAGAINAGEVWVNCHLEQTAELPHGGRGGSGHGTDLSTIALAEYQRPKTVTVRLD
ncbi:aldehyde dehydrogenase family protein [Micromonospora sp. CPCC 205546]|uniref:aldehyde dehydrogenase family protein n=1 Tax=Micromonospora sp. CPCC 205546 TaxID=3122397 RepID=UPI002FF09CB3